MKRRTGPIGPFVSSVSALVLTRQSSIPAFAIKTTLRVTGPAYGDFEILLPEPEPHMCNGCPWAGLLNISGYKNRRVVSFSTIAEAPLRLDPRRSLLRCSVAPAMIMSFGTIRKYDVSLRTYTNSTRCRLEEVGGGVGSNSLRRCQMLLEWTPMEYVSVVSLTKHPIACV